ncbi:MAG TPA: hypothetical protein VKZ71_02925, partial [Burkholderiaceae bacterium]|nr:hypothetical protein [Burkholderiaceae bacterium]
GVLISTAFIISAIVIIAPEILDWNFGAYPGAYRAPRGLSWYTKCTRRSARNLATPHATEEAGSMS